MIQPGEMVYLVCVDPKSNANKYYKIEHDGTKFVCTYGRVGESNFSTKTYPATEQQFRKLYKKTTRSKNPYTDMTELYATENEEVDESAVAPAVITQKPEVADFLKFLAGNARTTVQSALSVDVTTVTEKQVKASQEKLLAIVDTLKQSVEEANAMLVQQFAIVPRAINRRQGVESKLFRLGDNKWNNEVLDKEYELLDQMQTVVGVVKPTTTQVVEPDYELELVTDDEIYQRYYSGLRVDYKDSKVKRVFRVHHHKSTANFNDVGNVELLWHGSGTANWTSILSRCLQVRPPGVPTTGAMFGNGIYFAEISQKSVGYTSFRGSYWADGNNNSGVLALYNVATGKVFENKDGNGWSNKWTIEHAMDTGYDSLWCYGREKNSNSTLYNDEIIVGNGNQTNIQYIFEIGT